jgi:hypothetical protein
MSRISRFALPPALALVLAVAVAAQEPPKAGPPPMAQQRRAWMEQMQANNKRLDDLVARMNAAMGEARVDAIVAVLNEMVQQRKALQPHMGMGMGAPMGAPPPQGGAK